MTYDVFTLIHLSNPAEKSLRAKIEGVGAGESHANDTFRRCDFVIILIESCRAVGECCL